jgi:tRNA(Ile)-lysidine synthase
MTIEETVRSVIAEEGLIRAGDRVLVGVSGGIDSSVLLAVLDRLKGDLSFGLGVAHVNHQLRGAESQRDEAFVQEQAAALGVTCHIARRDVRGYAETQGLSLQHAGRDVRYAFFDEIADAQGYDRIAIAHNRDDQVETFLLRVIKGTGISGLSSIPISRGRIIRPLLRSYRSEIEAYAAGHGVRYVEDSSNAKNAYERNFVRNRIVPSMEELNPAFREKILLLLSDIAQVNAVFDGEAAAFLGREGRREEGRIVVGVEKLAGLHPEVRFRVISGILGEIAPQFIPLRQHVYLVEKSLFSKRPNNSVTLPYGVRVRRAYGDLAFSTATAAAAVSGVFAVGPGVNDLPQLGISVEIAAVDRRPDGLGGDRNTAVLDADRTGYLSIRTFREGDRFVPLGMGQSVKLKDYFMSKKLPAERRRRLPLLMSGNDIIWLVGERIDERYKVDDTTRRFLVITVRPMQ